MAEQSIQQPDPIEETAVVAEEEHESSGVPKGAIAFGVLMILGYAFYFFMIWTEVIARGGQ